MFVGIMRKLLLCLAVACSMVGVPAQAAPPPAHEADIVASFPLGTEDFGIGRPVFSPDGTAVYLPERDGTDGTRQNIRVVDARTHATKSVLRVGAQYQSIVGLEISKDGRTLYALQPSGPGAAGQVNVIDTGTGTQTATVFMPTTYGNSIPGWLGYEALSPDGRYLYLTRTGDVIVPGSPEQGILFVLDTTTNTVVGQTTVKGWIPGGVVVSPDGRNVYVPTEDVGFPDKTVVRHFDTTVVPPRYVGDVTMPTTENILDIALSGDGSRLYVIGDYQTAVRVIDTRTDTMVARIEIPNRSYSSPIVLSHDGKRLYVGNTAVDQWQDPTVTVVDTGTGTIAGTLVGFDLENHFGLALSRDDHTLYLVGGTFSEDGGKLPVGMVQVARL